MIKKILLVIALFVSITSMNSQTLVSSLVELQSAVMNSDQEIVLEAGNYYLEDLPSDSRFIDCSGSNNVIDMTGTIIRALVGSTIYDRSYFVISGNSNVLRNGAIEDYYESGLDEVTDFSAYNNDRANLAHGLSSPVMTVSGNDNLVEGLEMTVKGSFPYGYGSQYGIGGTNTFGLGKRSGILITGIDGGGVGNTLDGVTMYHRAFGHGIFTQSGADETTVKNCYVEGRMRLSDDIYNDTETYDLPYLTDYKFPTGDDWRTLPFIESYDVPRGENSVVYPLSEDGIRAYPDTGSVVVENCTIKQMRGGIRLYLGGSATVSNSIAIDCGSGGTNFNLPSDATVTGSSGNFTYTTLSDFRLGRSRMDIEMTIIPSPNAIGPHNIADILGNNHNIVFHRTSGPLDDDEERPIVVYGNNSTIVNETEYKIVLESGTSGNTIISCGAVTDNGSGNEVTLSEDCFSNTSSCATKDAFVEIEAEDYCSQTGVEIDASNSYVENSHDGDWIKFDEIDFGNGANVVTVVASTTKDNGVLEIRQGTSFGTLLGSIVIGNTGNWGAYETFSSDIETITGNQENIYFVFTGDSGFLFNIDFIKFSEDSSLSNDEFEYNINKASIYPNPIVSTATITGAVDSIINIYDLNGKTLLTKEIATDSEELNLSSFSTGVYYAQVYGAKSISVIKILVE